MKEILKLNAMIWVPLGSAFALTILKALGLVSWSWWVVTAPLWFSYLTITGIIVLTVQFFMVRDLWNEILDVWEKTDDGR